MNEDGSKELTSKEKEILDVGLTELTENKANFEGIKSGVISKTALSLLHDAGTKKSKIARLLIEKYAPNKETSKETGVSKYLIYKVLREPKFKEAKSEKHAKSKRGRSTKKSITRFADKSNETPSPTCAEVLSSEIKRIRQEKPELSNRQIKAIVLTLDSVKQYAASTLRNECATLLPVFTDHTPKVVSSIFPQDVQDQQQLRKDMIERMIQFQPILEWLSGMDEAHRTRFRKGLAKGKAYTLALEEKCRDHIIWLVKRMEASHIETFLTYTDELAHLNRVFDDQLYNEKLLREKKRDLSSV